uniref:Uncharacterized protein n=1 Tax=Anguilla anguilla TaxID=7936 RepID=A0A0E9SQ03_ANGAN
MQARWNSVKHLPNYTSSSCIRLVHLSYLLILLTFQS